MQLDGLGGKVEAVRATVVVMATPTDEVINSALRYRVQAPMVDSLLADIGIDGSNLSKQGGLMREASDLNRIITERDRAARGGKVDNGKGGGSSGPPDAKPAGDDDPKAKK